MLHACIKRSADGSTMVFFAALPGWGVVIIHLDFRRRDKEKSFAS
jgi:hypothetical protein